MTPLLTLTRREIVDRRALIWGTLFAALFPLIARLQPWFRPRDSHEILATAFGATFSVALAIGLGGSVVGEDLAGRRLGFYFSRPLRGLTIWAAKTLAAAIIAVGAWACFIVPLILLSDSPIGPGLRVGALVLVGLIFVAQAVAGAYRAHDGLFAVDIACFAAVVAAAALIGDRLVAAGVSPPYLPVLPIVALSVLALAAGVAAAVQVVVGRTDARRGHIALSLCLWGTLGIALLAAGTFSRYVLSLSPRDTGAEAFYLDTTPSASHLTFLARQDRFGYKPMFLLDPATGDFEALPRHRLRGGPTFSADGRRAAWIEGVDKARTLVRRELGEQKPVTIRSVLPTQDGSEAWIIGLSPNGGRAVVAFRDRVAILETDSGREAASFPMSRLGLDAKWSLWRSQAAFIGESVCIYFVPPPIGGLAVGVVCADVRTGQVTPGPRVEGSWLSAVRGGRALVASMSGTLELVGPSQVLRLETKGSWRPLPQATLLEDGRAAALVDRSGERRLLVWGPDGSLQLDVPAPAGEWLFGGEPHTGWLALGASFNWPAETVFIDLADGRVVRREVGLVPSLRMDAGHDLPAGSPGSRVFVGTRGEVVRIDPQTGQREAVLVRAPAGAKPSVGADLPGVPAPAGAVE